MNLICFTMTLRLSIAMSQKEFGDSGGDKQTFFWLAAVGWEGVTERDL